jgi:hypothetical protein
VEISGKARKKLFTLPGLLIQFPNFPTRSLAVSVIVSQIARCFDTLIALPSIAGFRPAQYGNARA